MERKDSISPIVLLFVSLSVFLITGMFTTVHGQTSSKYCADGNTVTFPDVCIMNPDVPVGIPVPYPNIGNSSNTKGSKIVKTAKGEDGECEARFNYFFGLLDENCYMNQDMRLLEER